MLLERPLVRGSLADLDRLAELTRRRKMHTVAPTREVSAALASGAAGPAAATLRVNLRARVGGGVCRSAFPQDFLNTPHRVLHVSMCFLWLESHLDPFEPGPETFGVHHWCAAFAAGSRP